MEVTVDADQRLYISVHHAFNARLIPIEDDAVMKDRTAKREIKIGNVVIVLFEDD